MAAQYTMPVEDRRIVKSWTEHSSNHAPLHSLENPSVILQWQYHTVTLFKPKYDFHQVKSSLGPFDLDIFAENVDFSYAREETYLFQVWSFHEFPFCTYGREQDRQTDRQTEGTIA